MRLHLLILSSMLLLPSWLYAGDIYQWVDETGRTQMSDVVPAKYRSVAKRVGTSSPAPAMQSASDAEKARQRIRAATAATAAGRQEHHGFPDQDAQDDSDESPPSECAALWQAYRQSLECFGHYRGLDNSMNPAAFKVCQEATDPSSRCGSPKP